MSTPRDVAFIKSLLIEHDAPESPTVDACPNPTIFWSLTQKGLAGSPMVAELREHLAKCPSCKDLTRRLQAFHHAVSDDDEAAPEAEWVEAAPRLERRMQAFLESETGKQRPKPKVLRFPALRWTLPLALAGCAAAVAIFGVMLERNELPLRSSEPSQLASTSGRKGDIGHGPPIAPGNDGNILTAESRVPDSLALPPGEHFKLLLTSVEFQPDGSYRFTGTLLGATEDEKSSFEVTGVWTEAAQEGHPKLSIQEVNEGSARYRSSMGGSAAQIAGALPQEGNSAPLVGQTLEVEILKGGTLQKARP
jgi:hypothetical protein